MAPRNYSELGRSLGLLGDQLPWYWKVVSVGSAWSLLTGYVMCFLFVLISAAAVEVEVEVEVEFASFWPEPANANDIRFFCRDVASSSSPSPWSPTARSWERTRMRSWEPPSSSLRLHTFSARSTTCGGAGVSTSSTLSSCMGSYV